MARFTKLVFIVLISAVGQTAIAQQQDSRTRNSLLPEIDPQDIEIRSQFKARFPGLTRQPILGFSPEPRVYQIDPGRMPFMETQDQVVANVPVSELSRPNPPNYVPLQYHPEINAYTRAGFGSFTSPEVKFWGVTRFENTGYLGGDLDFNSSAGHLDSQPSSFRNLQANLEYGTKLNPQTQLDVFGGIRSDFLYNGLNSGDLNGTNTGRKEINGFNIGSQIRSMQNGVTGWSADAAFRSFSASQFDASGEDTGNEWVYDTGFKYQWAGSEINEVWQLKAKVRGGFYNQNSGASSNWNTFGGSLMYDRLFNYSTKITAEAGIFYITNPADNKVYFAPRFKVKHWFTGDFTVEARIYGKPYVYSREELNRQNRFLFTNQQLRHSYSLETAVELNYNFLGESNLYGGISYHYGENYPVFQSIPITSIINNPPAHPYLFEAQYPDAHIYKVYGGISYQVVPERLWFNAEGYIQIPKYKGPPSLGTTDRIPYKELWGINGGISFRPVEQVKLEAWGDIVGPRNSGFTNTELKTIILLGGRVDVDIMDRFGAYAKLVNLLSQEYQLWPGYTERPLQVFAGITVKL